MGMLDWIKGGTQKGSPPETPKSGGESGVEVAGLNFKLAVDAHMKWKGRLENYINGTSDETLEVDVVCRDDRCVLGKWIYGEGGQRFGFSDTFGDMKENHAQFHRNAAEILGKAQEGLTHEALHLLHRGEYGRQSERVKMALARLFVLVSDGKAALDAHQKWKGRLRDAVLAPAGSDMTVAGISSDAGCQLGQWLYGPAKEKYAHLPAYHWVKEWHAQFHMKAGEVLSLAQKGEKEAALLMLEQGECAKASDQVTAALVALFEQQEADRR